MKLRKRKKKNSNFIGENPEFAMYKKGVFAGAILGGVTGLLLNKRIILFTLLGGVVGGYVAYQINSDNSNTLNLKKFRKQKSTTLTKKNGADTEEDED